MGGVPDPVLKILVPAARPRRTERQAAGPDQPPGLGWR